MIGVIKGTMRQAKEVGGLPLPIASYKANVKGNLKSLNVAITATQSGSGDPYPAGGGKNMLPMTVANLKAGNTSGSWSGNVYANGTVTYTLQTDSGNNVIGIVVNGTPSSTNVFSLGSYTISAGTYALSGCASGGSNSTYYLDVRNDGGSQIIDNGNGASFTSSGQSGKYGRIVVTSGTTMTNKLFTPMLRLSSTSDEYAPYSNIRPISGWSECNVVRCGVNVWDGTIESGDILVTSDGSNHSNANRMRSGNYIPVSPSTSYYVTSNYPNTIIAFYAYDKSYPYNTQNVGWITLPANKVITIPDWCYYIRFYLNATSETYNNDISINYPATDTDYHAYNGNTYTIQLGDTYYGGSLDVTTGELTVTHTNIASYAGESINEPWICSEAVYSEGATPPTGSQVVYPLATPITVQLTPTQVEQLLVNNVWADTGDVEELKYFDRQVYYGR